MFLSLCDVVAENDVCQLEKKTKTQTLISLHLKKKKRMGWKFDEGLKKRKS